jgi:hypothetical protein
MPYQNISATVSAEDIAAIKAAIQTIQQKLPFLVNLTEDERRSLPKAGTNSLSFVRDALTAAQNNPSILPASFKVGEFDSDVSLFAVLTDVNISLNQLTSQVDDTRMAVGSETMRGGRKVYDYVKAAVKETPGLKPVADQLGERFKRTTVAKPVEKPA